MHTMPRVPLWLQVQVALVVPPGAVTTGGILSGMRFVANGSQAGHTAPVTTA